MATVLNLLKELKYAFYLMFHPFDGFWDLKHEKKGSVRAATTIVALIAVSYIVRFLYTGFLFNPRNYNRFNIFYEFSSVFIPFLLWCVANWCFTTLMDGEGSFKDIYVASAYALFPLVITMIPMALLSNIVIIEEGDFVLYINMLAGVWAAFLMFCGTLVTHQYTIGKTILTIFMIIIGMAFMLFIGLLVFNLFQQIVSFVISIYREITFRN